MKRIQSKLHRIGTYGICKVSLSCFDDKRYILDDGVNYFMGLFSLGYKKSIRVLKLIRAS